MCFLNFYSILFGKLAFGFASAVVVIAAPKMIDETCPIYKLKLFGLATNFYLSLGVTIAMVMGLWLPKPDDIDGMKTNQLWRYIFGMPAVWAILQIICLLTILKYDSIMFLIQQGNNDDALKMISKVYKLI